MAEFPHSQTKSKANFFSDLHSKSYHPYYIIHCYISSTLNCHNMCWSFFALYFLLHSYSANTENDPGLFSFCANSRSAHILLQGRLQHLHYHLAPPGDHVWILRHHFSPVQEAKLAPRCPSTTAIKTNLFFCRASMSPTRPNLPAVGPELGKESAAFLPAEQPPSYGSITSHRTWQLHSRKSFSPFADILPWLPPQTQLTTGELCQHQLLWECGHTKRTKTPVPLALLMYKAATALNARWKKLKSILLLSQG